jgi:hypothetical protein
VGIVAGAIIASAVVIKAIISYENSSLKSGIKSRVERGIGSQEPILICA